MHDLWVSVTIIGIGIVAYCLIRLYHKLTTGDWF